MTEEEKKAMEEKEMQKDDKREDLHNDEKQVRAEKDDGEKVRDTGDIQKKALDNVDAEKDNRKEAERKEKDRADERNGEERYLKEERKDGRDEEIKRIKNEWLNSSVREEMALAGIPTEKIARGFRLVEIENCIDEKGYPDKERIKEEVTKVVEEFPEWKTKAAKNETKSDVKVGVGNSEDERKEANEDIKDALLRK